MGEQRHIYPLAQFTSGSKIPGSVPKSQEVHRWLQLEKEHPGQIKSQTQSRQNRAGFRRIQSPKPEFFGLQPPHCQPICRRQSEGSGKRRHAPPASVAAENAQQHSGDNQQHKQRQHRADKKARYFFCFHFTLPPKSFPGCPGKPQFRAPLFL